MVFILLLFQNQSEFCTHVHLIPSCAMCLFRVRKKFGNVPFVFMLVVVLVIKGRFCCKFHMIELMSGMIAVLMQNVEEALLDVHLSCDEELDVFQAGTNLFLDLINRLYR
jgi:hypothetical protein